MQLTLGSGLYSRFFISTTTQDVLNYYSVIQVVTDTVFTALTNHMGNPSSWAGEGYLGGITVPAGTMLYGAFTDIELDSGQVIAMTSQLRVSEVASGDGDKAKITCTGCAPATGSLVRIIRCDMNSYSPAIEVVTKVDENDFLITQEYTRDDTTMTWIPVDMGA